MLYGHFCAHARLNGPTPHYMEIIIIIIIIIIIKATRL